MTGWRDILDPIGWPLLERASPILAANLATRMNEDGGLAASAPSVARQEARGLDRLARLLFEAAKGLEDLPPDERRAIGLATMRTPPTQNIDVPDPVTEALSALWQVIDGLSARLDRLDDLAAKGGRGGQAKLPARRIAEAIAMLWIVARGDLPTLGRLADGSGLSGEYGRCVERVLASARVKCADAYRPARDALDGVAADEATIRALLLIRCPLTRHLVTAQMARKP